MDTVPYGSPERSERKRLKPCPPVITLTPDTWAWAHRVNWEAPADAAKSTTNLAAFCLVGPCSALSIDCNSGGISTLMPRRRHSFNSLGKLSRGYANVSGQRFIQQQPDSLKGAVMNSTRSTSFVFFRLFTISRTALAFPLTCIVSTHV